VATSTAPDKTTNATVEIVPNPEVAVRSPTGAVTGVLLRFISCGILSVTAGLLWRFNGAPAQIDIASALGDAFVLLAGFIVGGLLWYVHDVRVRRRHPERISDERMVFSFVVFTLMPLAVLILVGIIWLFSLLLGA
jgi:nitrate reductase NapE component